MTIPNINTPDLNKENPTEVLSPAAERLLLIEQTQDKLAFLARNANYAPLPAAYQI